MKNLLNKYKLTIPELNEKIIAVNEDSRKLISNVIMENTIYNIVSEAGCGETNLLKTQEFISLIEKKNIFIL